MIDDAQDLGKLGVGTMPFKPWPAQIDVLWSLMDERLFIILKARQLGISWIVCWYVMWRCVFNSGQLWLLFSKGQNEANELIRRIRVLYERLPDWLRTNLPAQILPGSVKAIEWTNGSRVNSMPATKTSGVSYTASGVVLDEAAKLQFGSDLFTAVKPTIDAGGQMIILSTADGFDPLFSVVWEKAALGLNGFKSIFLPWWARPDRNREWYEGKIRETPDPQMVKQEYPSSAVEAFLVSGRTKFPPDQIDAMAGGLADPISLRFYPDELKVRPEWPGLPEDKSLAVIEIPGLHIFQFPDPTRRYIIAGDVAEGKDPLGKNDPDFDAAVVVDEETWEEVAVLHGRWAPDEYGRFLISLGHAYNLADIIVERNNHGHAVLATLKLLNYPRVAPGHDDDPGWLTNTFTKPTGIDLLGQCLRDRVYTVRYEPTLMEMRYYIVHQNGSTSAREGKHDDLVMAWYLFVSYARWRKNRPNHGPPRAVGDRFRTRNFIGSPAVRGVRPQPQR